MERISIRNEKIRELEFKLTDESPAVLELEGNKLSEREINQLKRNLENMKYKVLYVNSDEKNRIYHIYIVKYQNLKNA